MYEVPRIIIEVASAIIYIVLVKYMIKPYSLTREQRYLGLPLGFAFLGLSEIILTIQIVFPLTQLPGLSVATRTFAFVFLAITYYFSKKPAKNSQIVWTLTLSLLIIISAVLCLILVGAPLLNLQVPVSFSIFLRVLGLFFIAFISLHTLNSHIKKPEPTTIWIPLGFIMLGISQYSQIIRIIDGSYAYGAAFVGSLVARFIGLAIFLFVAYRTFYGSKKREGVDEKNRA
ncbi:MAG TPA: hypothetical protein VLH35_03500 [Candidatus Acidoferrales bacterium]|nr:hypothetical protein [Candidatus Acidoferrales bacterium]